MKPEAQRIAIAEACGWTRVPDSRGRRWCKHYLCLGPHHSLGSLPDYLTDLNAIHEAVETLFQAGATPGCGYSYQTFCDHLKKMHAYSDSAFHATADQRAEAFLRTLGKWVEE